MSLLFRIETDRVRLKWSEARDKPPPALSGAGPEHGTLHVRLLRREAASSFSIFRASPTAAATHLAVRAGPRLFEHRDYRLTAVAIPGHQKVEVTHRDPNILNRFDDEPGRVDALIDFGSQVGTSTFRVLVDGTPELEFDVEVFPTKLDYKTDYERMLAEVQDTLYGLAFEYLRATWRGATQVDTPTPTRIEWLVLLRSVVDALDRALRRVASHPIRGLRRDPVPRRPDQVLRVDSGIRSALMRHAQRGLAGVVVAGVPMPHRITERRAQPTLDTPEHRWLATQVDRIRQRLAELIVAERGRGDAPPPARKVAILAELRGLEARVSRWYELEPLKAAQGPPPIGFASLQLLSAAGYREAYRACMTLAMGLRLEGGPLQLSLKDLHELYEHWCYLALLRLIAEESKAPIDPRAILVVKDRGLSVDLKKGKESKVPFRLKNDRHLTVRYSPSMRQGALVPQRPDMLLTLEHPDWPAVHLVLDAKYRVDTSPKYLKAYGVAGPPEDALNAMHRYRDAILEEVDGASQRTVVQAAALYPPRDDSKVFEESRLWSALERVGVGAIPLLPDNVDFLRQWLARWLDHGGWDLADNAIDHLAIRKAAEWRRAAAAPVLIGSLRGEDPAQHLAWIAEARRYYTPLSLTQPRLLATQTVAFYEPARLDKAHKRGAVRHFAEVQDVRIVRRKEIETPWPSGREDREVVLYELGPVTPLSRAIVNADGAGRGDRVGVRRWSSRLALDRARTLSELLLESEPEWRLHEELNAAGLRFDLSAQTPKLRTEDDLQARVMFVLGTDTQVCWKGAAGFVIRSVDGREVTAPTPRRVVEMLRVSASVRPQ